MRDHHKLRAFELTDDIAVMTYKITKCFPKEEMYGLTTQMRRASVSAPSNIVEGCARKSQKEYKQFLNIAFSSLRELHYQFGLACRLGYISLSDAKEYEAKITETEKVLVALIRSLE